MKSRTKQELIKSIESVLPKITDDQLLDVWRYVNEHTPIHWHIVVPMTLAASVQIYDGKTLNEIN